MIHRFERPAIDRRGRAAAGRRRIWAVLAGGTDLYPAHVGRPIAAPLLDITAIDGLRGIRRDAARLDDRRDHDLDRRRPRRPAAAVRRAQGGGARGRRRADPEHRHRRRQRCATPRRRPTARRCCWRSAPSVVLQSARGERALAARRVRARQPRARRVRADELVVAVRIPARCRARALGVRQARRPALPRRSRSRMVAVVVDVDAAGASPTPASRSAAARRCAQRLPALEARLVGRRGRCRAWPTVLEPADLAPLTPIDDLRAQRRVPPRRDRDACSRRAPRRACRPRERRRSRAEPSDDRARCQRCRSCACDVNGRARELVGDRRGASPTRCATSSA